MSRRITIFSLLAWGLTSCVALGSPGGSPEAVVPLARGGSKSYSWQVAVHRSPGPNGTRRPCLDASSETRAASGGWSGSRFSLCGVLSQAPILIGKSAGSGQTERTLLAFAYPVNVVAVKIWLGRRGARRIGLDLLSEAQAQRAKVDRFRYLAVNFAGRFCLTRVVSFDARGHVVDPGTRKECGR
jgi:hypothetical protein